MDDDSKEKHWSPLAIKEVLDLVRTLENNYPSMAKKELNVDRLFHYYTTFQEVSLEANKNKKLRGHVFLIHLVVEVEEEDGVRMLVQTVAKGMSAVQSSLGPPC